MIKGSKISDIKIEVKVGKTVNLGNYESFRIDLGIDGMIPEKTNVEKEYDILFDFLTSLATKYERQKTK